MDKAPPDLYGFKPARQVLQKEDPQDRLILLLKAQGWTNRRIAQELGLSELKVNYTVRQPWFMRQLVNLLHEKGEAEIERLIQVFSRDAIEVAHEIMMNSEDERLRAQAAFEFIRAQRGVKITFEQPKPLNQIEEEIKLLEEEISKIERTGLSEVSRTEETETSLAKGA